MPTSTFCDVTFTEKVENYTLENKERNFEEGETVSLPRRIGYKFINKWGKAEPASEPYEVRDDEYDTILCRRKDQDEVCDTVKSSGEVCGREKPCPYHGDE